MFRAFYGEDHWMQYISELFGLQRAKLFDFSPLRGEYLIYDAS